MTGPIREERQELSLAKWVKVKDGGINLAGVSQQTASPRLEECAAPADDVFDLRC